MSEMNQTMEGTKANARSRNIGGFGARIALAGIAAMTALPGGGTVVAGLDRMIDREIRPSRRHGPSGYALRAGVKEGETFTDARGRKYVEIKVTRRRVKE